MDHGSDVWIVLCAFQNPPGTVTFDGDDDGVTAVNDYTCHSMANVRDDETHAHGAQKSGFAMSIDDGDYILPYHHLYVCGDRDDCDRDRWPHCYSKAMTQS